jgi:hypothetical protein
MASSENKDSPPSQLALVWPCRPRQLVSFFENENRNFYNIHVASGRPPPLRVFSLVR